VRRLFWLAFGLGAGVAGALVASRWMRQQADKMAPAHVAKEMQSNLIDLSKRVADSVAEGKKAMEDKERELRSGSSSSAS
jgi:hypothetical protein